MGRNTNSYSGRVVQYSQEKGDGVIEPTAPDIFGNRILSFENAHCTSEIMSQLENFENVDTFEQGLRVKFCISDTESTIVSVEAM